MSLRFPDRPATTLPELQRNVLELFYQLGAGAEGVLHRDVEISSAGTKFAHGLRGVPRSALIVAKEQTEGPPYLDPDNLPTAGLLYLKAVPTTVHGIFVAGTGAGARDCLQADVGDVVEVVLDATTGDPIEDSFESTITVNDQIQQTSGGFSGDICLVILKRPVTVTCDLLVLP